jgi:hypothetical protein
MSELNCPVITGIFLRLCLAGTVALPALAGAVDHSETVLAFKDQTGRIIRYKALPDPNWLVLRNQQVDLREHAIKPSDVSADHPVPLIVSLAGPISSLQQAQLVATGAQVIGPLPPAGFLVRANADAAARLADLENVAVIARFDDAWKLSNRLPPGPVPGALEIVLFAGVDPEPVMKQIAQWGEVKWLARALDRAVIGVIMSADAWALVAALPEVEMVDAAGVGSMMNNEVRVVMQTEKAHHSANQAFYNPIYSIGVWGEGQTVTLADSGLEDHQVFARPNQIAGNYPAANSCVEGTGDSWNHGTGVAATLLGDHIGQSGFFDTANDYDGLALRADLVMQDIVHQNPLKGFCPPVDYAGDLFAPAWQAGSMVHSNSWGHWAIINNPTGTYSWRSQMIDQYMNDPQRREHVIVYAAGNAGATYMHPNLPNGTYMPFSLSDEAHSKNATVVGGSGNGSARDLMYPYSSRGPTDDCLNDPCPGIQRVKPDLVAPAHYYVDTADTGCPSCYSIFPGTSVAAPAVAAAAALVRDYFAQGIYPVIPQDPPLGGAPSSALIKAILVNATVPIYDPTGYEGNAAQNLPADAYPNYDQGYGRPALDNVLEPAGYRKLKVYENATTTSDTGSVWRRTLKYREKWGASCNTLRVTLAWNDPPATLVAGTKLVNDLDLEVQFLSQTYKGNHLLTGNTAFDTVNNVEDVFIPLGKQHRNTLLQPTVRVYGSSVPSGPQPFAVVATYGACADDLSCLPNNTAGGCYRGPGDVVPGSQWNPGPGCADQDYSSGEFDGQEDPYPHCKAKSGPRPMIIPPQQL